MKTKDIEEAASKLEELGSILRGLIEKYSYDEVADFFRVKYGRDLHVIEELEILSYIFTITEPADKVHCLDHAGAMYRMKSESLIVLVEYGEIARTIASSSPDHVTFNEMLESLLAHCMSVGRGAQEQLYERISEYEHEINDLTKRTRGYYVKNQVKSRNQEES